MKAKFGGKLRVGTKAPMCPGKAQIEKWQAGGKKEIKQKIKQGQQRAKAAGGGPGSTQQCPGTPKTLSN